MAPPPRIVFPCEECGKWTEHTFIGRHGPYVLYECTECGKCHLVHQSIAILFTDYSKLGQPA